MSWIVDPSRDDDALRHFLCGAAGVVRCAASRACEPDALLTANRALNRSCAGVCHACLHKQLLPPDTADAYGSALLFVSGVLAGVCGIGGGGLNVPILLLCHHFLFVEADTS